MFIGRQSQTSYNVEIAQLGYSISFENGSEVDIKGADLIRFMELYVPEIDMEPYAAFSTQYLKYRQNIDLLHFLRNGFHDIISDYFFQSLYELTLDVAADSYDLPRFEKMKSENIDGFMVTAANLYDTVKYHENLSLCAIQILSADDVKQWDFANGLMSLIDDEVVITLTAQTISKMAEHFKQDFILNGESTLNLINAGKIDVNEYKSLDYFLDNFEQDLEKFKADGFTFEGFVELMVNYKLCDTFD